MGKHKHKKIRTFEKPPKEGTQVRVVYDYFLSKPYELLERKQLLDHVKLTSFNVALDQLTDFYGLDIRSMGFGKYMLVGRWLNGKYIDFCDKLFDSVSDNMLV